MKRTYTLLASLIVLSVACRETDSDGDGGDGGSGGSGPSTTATTSTKSSSSTSTGTTTGSTSTATVTATTNTATTTGMGGEGGTGGGMGMACAHDVCTEGVALDALCNDPCVATVCADDDYCCDMAGGEWDVACIDIAVDLCQAACAVPVAIGDLIITEIMNNPNEVSDTNGEWIEIHNATGADIDLNGFNVYDAAGGNALPITASVVVAAGGYVVIGKNDDTATNGGVTVDYEISALSLGNTGADYLAIESPGLEIIDELIFDEASGLDPDGASRSLDPNFLDAAANDDDTNFCEATSFISGGMGDTGTPGAANDACP